MKTKYKVVIAGGGMTGLALAALLKQSAQGDRLEVTLVDAAPRPTFDATADTSLRVSAIAAGSARLLDCLGAWHSIVETRACRYEHMRVWDAADPADGAATLRFDADEHGVAELGHIVENLLIRHELLDVIDGLDVELMFQSPVDSLVRESSRSRVTLADGSEIETDLLIAADGSRSTIRELAGIDTRQHAYAQTAFVTHMQPERPHAYTAWQRFLDTGPLALLPLDDGRVSIVWSTTPELARHAMQASDADVSSMLTAVSDRVLGTLSVDGPRGTFPLIASHAERYVEAGLALVGDAAHAVHPLAGQGANLGFQDVEALGAVIDSALARGEHPGDRPVLRRYERRRRGANATMMHFLTALNRLYASESVLIRGLRRTGMRLFNASGVIRDQAIGVALGMNPR